MVRSLLKSSGFCCVQATASPTASRLLPGRREHRFVFTADDEDLALVIGLGQQARTDPTASMFGILMSTAMMSGASALARLMTPRESDVAKAS